MKRMTMKLVAAGAIAAAVVPAVVWAADQTFELTATSPPFCQFNSIAYSSLNNATTSGVTTAGSTVRITNPINSATGKLVTAGFQLDMASICNTSSRVVLITQSGAMKHTSAGGVPGTLATLINYTAAMTFPGSGNSVAILTTDGTPKSEIGNTISGPRVGNTRVIFSIDAQQATVVAAGEYADILTVRLEPQ